MITQGRIVVYTLSAGDAEKINRLRTDGASIALRMKIRVRGEHEAHTAWPAGAQAHIGNAVKVGYQFPAMVVATAKNEGSSEEDGVKSEWCQETVNLQVFLDGNDVYWATSVEEDSSKTPAPGTWSWPARS